MEQPFANPRLSHFITAVSVVNGVGVARITNNKGVDGVCKRVNISTSSIGLPVLGQSLRVFKVSGQ